MSDWTKSKVTAEIEEKSLDLKAFCEAREIVRARVLEVLDSQSPLTPLPNWAGTDAVLGSLDLAIHSMERTIDELRLLLQSARDDRAHLRVVGDEDVEA